MKILWVVDDGSDIIHESKINDDVLVYECKDGYVGKSRIQYSEIDEKVICECETVNDVKELIYRIARIDFNKRISYYIDNLNEIIQYWKENKT